MDISLSQILNLTGRLDDGPGIHSPRERFREFLQNDVKELGQVRDYIEECLRTTGDQYNRALQDLVNFIGHFLGFEVVFGRYQGVRGEIGFDGHWKSPTGFHIVVEVKTTDVYAIKAATLVGYVDESISAKEIPSWDNALGLYVIGRRDPDLRQLENAIVAEKRTHQLRIISVNALLSLAEMMNEYDVGHDDILAVIKPSEPSIDSIVDLMARLVAGPTETIDEPEAAILTPEPAQEDEAVHWLSPVKSHEEETAEECIQKLVGSEHIYAFGERTPGRKHLKPGDWICFYETGKGVTAHAQVKSAPKRAPHPKVRDADRYPWVFQLAETKLYCDNPVIIDRPLRDRLDAFEGRDPNRSWAWFVQATRRISRHDFQLLTR